MPKKADMGIKEPLDGEVIHRQAKTPHLLLKVPGLSAWCGLVGQGAGLPGTCDGCSHSPFLSRVQRASSSA